MKILITGTAGFIGYHLTKVLLKRGDTVVGIDNINDYYDVSLKYARLSDLGICENDISYGNMVTSSIYPNHKFIKMDIEDKEKLNELFSLEKFDAVCNLAAQAGVRYSLDNPDAYISSNIIGFMNILECCRKNSVKNLSFASSSSVYGLNKSQPFKTSDSCNHQVSLYAATKKSNEMMAHTYAHLYGLQITGLRFFTVYGPWGRPDMAPMIFANAILNDKDIKVFNHGNMSRDFTYIDDIVDGVVKVIDNPAKSSMKFDPNNPDPSTSSAPYKIYNIGKNSPTNLLSFIEILENVIGKKTKKLYLDMQPGDVESTYADVSDLINDLNYKPSTDLVDGINMFVKWYKEFYREVKNDK